MAEAKKTKGSKAKGRRSSKDKNYYAVQTHKTLQNKIRRRKRWLKKQARLADPVRQARLTAERKERQAKNRAARESRKTATQKAIAAKLAELRTVPNHNPEQISVQPNNENQNQIQEAVSV